MRRFLLACLALLPLAGCASNLKDENARLQTENAQLVAQLNLCQTGHEALRSTLTDCQGSTTGLQAKLVQAQNESRGYFNRLLQAQTEFDALQSRLDQTTASLTQSTTRIRELTGQLSAAYQGAIDAQNRANEASRVAESLRIRADQNAEALAVANGQLSTMRKALSDAAAARDQSVKQLAELSRQFAEFQHRGTSRPAAPNRVANAPER